MIKKQNKSWKKILLKIALIISLILILLLSAYLVWSFLSSSKISNEIEDSATNQTVVNDRDLNEEKPSLDKWNVAPEKPRYLSIEKLNIINARVLEIGLINDNQLDSPKNIHDVGWYRDSSLPGSNNTTYAGLYDGHNFGTSQNGVFYRLGNIAIGDVIKIERGDGKTFNYTVREVETPALEEVDMKKMQKPFNPSVEGLNIISCNGEYDKERQTYSHRVTVRATL